MKDKKQKVLGMQVIYPSVIPRCATEDYKKLFKQGWEEYRSKIKEDLIEAKHISDILKIANHKVELRAGVSKDYVGYMAGWNAYRVFLKKTFFG